MPRGACGRHDRRGTPPVGCVPAVLTVRSILFNVLFYLNLLCRMLALLPTLLMPRRFTQVLPRDERVVARVESP